MDQVLHELDPELTQNGGTGKTLSLEDEVKKFGQSLKAVTSLEGLLKAKSRFLAFINREESRCSKEELKKFVDKEWKALTAKPITLHVGKIDFTELEQHLFAMAAKEEEVSKLSPAAPQPLGNGPPPPPPPPGHGPPPPPGHLAARVPEAILIYTSLNPS